MNNTDQTRFKQLYEKHTNALVLQGKSPKTVEMYSRSVPRLSQFFDACPDHLLALNNKREYLCPCCKKPMNFILFFKRPKG